MTKGTFSAAIDKIDLAYVSEALNYSEKIKKTNVKRSTIFKIASVAACFAIVLVSVLAITMRQSPENKDNPIILHGDAESDKQIYVYGNYDNDVILNANETDRYNSNEYYDILAAYHISKSIFGKSYDLSYINSARFAFTGREVDVYSVKGIDDARVMVDKKSREIIKLHAFPYESVDFSDEESYLNYIKEGVGDSINLNDYEYSVETHYYHTLPNAMESKTVNGFIKCEGDYLLGDYCFYFSKSINGVYIEDHVTAEFYAKRSLLYFECISNNNSDYDDETITSMIEDQSNTVYNYVNEYINDRYELVNVETNSMHLYWNEEKPLLLVYTTIYFYDNNDSFNEGKEPLQSVLRLVLPLDVSFAKTGDG